ncbi:DUF2062 domain-containing protein [Sphingorhabdus sp. EL138]|uniref:DUF2062 domain-containing protein n=1 Tax=Sphingorhabdus sp. EL138 TaxID=2073156 RepID=UPI0020B16052|nr:DUF2062 domain-containing protein [Sphingorhabdus sp. EL138]
MADPNSPDKDWGARTIKRFYRWFAEKMPTRAGMANNRYLKPIAHRFLRSDLWRFTRRSVPRGVALGLLTGFVVPLGGQTFVALFLALPIRANVPIAAVTTFITNPFTYPFWLAIANQLGRFVLRMDGIASGISGDGQVNGLVEWTTWIIREVGVTFFGFVLLGIIFGGIGYVISSFGWRWWTARKWKRRIEKLGLDRDFDGK